MRIYAVTLNPALDLSGHVPRIAANEKNYVTHARFDPGGNGINSARMIARLGGNPVLLGFIGGGAGAQLCDLLAAEELPQRFTRIHGVTRTNVTVTNDHDHKQTRLTFPGPTIRRDEVKALRSEVQSLKSPGLVLFGGSMPPGCPDELYRELISIAARRQLGVVVDVPAKTLRAILRETTRKLLLIKPNQAELEELLGKRLRSDAAIADAAVAMGRKVALVCVSLGDRGAIFAVGGRAWIARAPQIKARGTVGAGDSMVGAIAMRLAHWKLCRSADLEKTTEEKLFDVFRWGVAAGAATAAAEGTSLGQPNLVRRLLSDVSIRPLPLRADHSHLFRINPSGV